MARKPREFRPWNKGKSVGQKRPFTPDQVQLITRTMIAGEEWRDVALFATGIDTMLRGSDLVALSVEEVCDDGGRIAEEFSVRQQKTNVGTVVALSAHARKALEDWIQHAHKLPEDFLFTRLKGETGKPLTRDLLARLVKKWARYARLDPKHDGSHLLGRTKTTLI